MELYAEIVNGVILQYVQSGEAITTSTGTQYPGAFPKADIPNVVAVTMTAAPSSATNTITGYTVEMVSAVPTQVWQSTPITLAAAQVAQSAAISTACAAYITGGMSYTTLAGVTYQISTTAQDQINATAAALVAQSAMARAAAWSASTTLAPNSIALVGSEYYLTPTGGKTGTTDPTWPTAYGTTVTDGTVTWELFGLLVGISTGVVYFGAQDVILAYEAGVAFINAARVKNAALQAQIAAATTVTAVQAITW